MTISMQPMSVEPGAFDPGQRRVLVLFAAGIMAYRLVRRWLQALHRAGYEVHIACPPDEYFDRLSQEGFLMHKVHMTRCLNPIEVVRSTISVLKLLRSSDFDFINIHGAMAGVVGRIAGALARKPTIYTNHGFTFQDDSTWAVRSIVLAVEWMLSRLTLHTMFICREDYEVAMKYGVVTPSSATLILNGIDTQAFSAEIGSPDKQTAKLQLGINPQRLVVGLIGRLIKEKGVREFVDASRIVLNVRQDLIFLIVGDSLNTDRGAYGKQMKKAVAQLGLSEKFVFTGFVDNVRPFLSAMDLLVHPTYRESFGLVIAEAMMMGVPVIASDVRGCRELIINGKTGILVPSKSPAELARAVMALGDDVAVRKKLASAASLRVRCNFDEQLVIGRFVSTIRGIVEGGSTCPSRQSSLKCR